MYEWTAFRRVITRRPLVSPLRCFLQLRFNSQGSRTGNRRNPRSIDKHALKKPLPNMPLARILVCAKLPVHAIKYARRWDSYMLTEEVQRLLRRGSVDSVMSAVTVCTRADPRESGVSYNLVTRELLERGNIDLAKSLYQDSKRRRVKLSERFFAAFLDGLLSAAKRTSAPISDTVTDIIEDCNSVFKGKIPSVIVNVALTCYGHEQNIVKIYEVLQDPQKNGELIKLDEYGFSIMFRILYNSVANLRSSSAAELKEMPEYQLLVHKVLELDDELNNLLSDKTDIPHIVMDSSLLNTRMAALSAATNDESRKRLKDILKTYLDIAEPFKDNYTYKNGIEIPCSKDQWKHIDSRKLFVNENLPSPLIQRFFEIYHIVYGSQGIYTLMEYLCYHLGGFPDGYTFKYVISTLDRGDDNRALLLGNFLLNQREDLSHGSVPIALHEVCCRCHSKELYRNSLKLLLKLACDRKVPILLMTLGRVLKRVESMEDLHDYVNYLSIFYSQKEIWNANYADPILRERQIDLLKRAVNMCYFVKSESEKHHIKISPEQERQYRDIKNTAIRLNANEAPTLFGQKKSYVRSDQTSDKERKSNLRSERPSSGYRGKDPSSKRSSRHDQQHFSR